MRSPFPGMDPYLEQPGVWSEVHIELIVGIRRFLTPILRPKYRVAIEQRAYLSVTPPDEFIGEPDVIVSVDNPSASHVPAATVTMTVEPLVGTLPMPEEVKERYLEIRKVDTKEVVTVIEVLSPVNKRAGKGREQYEEKRTEILGSRTNLIEVDLLRAGKVLPMAIPTESHYRIVVSRGWQRPSADFYLFSVRQPIPNVPVPLLRNDPEPLLDLNQILHDLYNQGGYDLDIDYSRMPPPPAFAKEDALWVRERTQRAQTSGHSNGSVPLASLDG